MYKGGMYIVFFTVCILILSIFSCYSNGSSAGNGSQTPNACIGTNRTAPQSNYREPESCWVKTATIAQND